MRTATRNQATAIKFEPIVIGLTASLIRFTLLHSSDSRAIMFSRSVIYLLQRQHKLNIRSSLIKSGGGTGPLKPGNRGHAAVPIPAGESLADEAH